MLTLQSKRPQNRVSRTWRHLVGFALYDRFFVVWGGSGQDAKPSGSDRPQFPSPSLIAILLVAGSLLPFSALAVSNSPFTEATKQTDEQLQLFGDETNTVHGDDLVPFQSNSDNQYQLEGRSNSTFSNDVSESSYLNVFDQADVEIVTDLSIDRFLARNLSLQQSGPEKSFWEWSQIESNFDYRGEIFESNGQFMATLFGISNLVLPVSRFVMFENPFKFNQIQETVNEERHKSNSNPAYPYSVQNTPDVGGIDNPYFQLASYQVNTGSGNNLNHDFNNGFGIRETNQFRLVSYSDPYQEDFDSDTVATSTVPVSAPSTSTNPNSERLASLFDEIPLNRTASNNSILGRTSRLDSHNLQFPSQKNRTGISENFNFSKVNGRMGLHNSYSLQGEQNSRIGFGSEQHANCRYPLQGETNSTRNLLKFGHGMKYWNQIGTTQPRCQTTFQSRNTNSQHEENYILIPHFKLGHIINAKSTINLVTDQ